MSSEAVIENNLFNDKKMEEFIELYDDVLNVNADCDPISYWIEKLENDELQNEKANYLAFFKIILEKILGYHLTDLDFEGNIGDEGRPVEFTLKKGDKDYVVVELKGTTCKDLNKRYNRQQSPIEQVTNYASIKEETQWAFVSNYNEFRFFNPSYREKYISFKFKQLTDPNVLKKFLLIFSKFSLIDKDIPQTLLKETRVIERKLEDEFYKLFSETRLMLIKELEYSSEDIDRIEAIRLAQLILNRFIFLCFAEDLRLIPTETTADVILTPIRHKNLFDFTMWDRLNELFRFADKGNIERGINAFNGGLFKESLRHLEIRDKVEDLSFFEDCYKTWKFEEKYEEIESLLDVYKDTLNPIYKNLLLISSFDFGSELSVNILGHIFENSIGDIEELKDETTERRKKDGVFYTSEYITDYICMNTIIPYLSKSGKANTIHELISEYEDLDLLDELDTKLKYIKIIDPACGSGAFLNKAVDILFEIHKALHDSKYANDPTLNKYFDSIDRRKQIIIDNIYGVDLNSESVEITKLSLFLKLATSTVVKEGFKLPNLDKNIKCGNSLIDDEDIGGNKAFDWKKEFKDIFDCNGFDIIIGNPPYVATKLIPENDRNYYWDRYKDVLFSEMDLYEIFMYKSFNELLKKDGYLGFITPNSYYTINSFKKLREYLLKNTSIIEIIDFPYRFYPFNDVNTETSISIYKKQINEENVCKLKIIDKELQEQCGSINKVFKSEDSIKQDYMTKLFNNTIVIKPNKLIIKMLKSPKRFKDYLTLHKGWMSVPKEIELDSTHYNKGIFQLNEIEEDTKLFDNCNPYLEGKDIHRYYVDDVDKYVFIKDMAEKTKSWHFSDKIILQRIVGQNKNKISATLDFDNNIIFPNANLVNLKENVEFDIGIFLGILNSKTISFYWNFFIGESNTNITKTAFESIPIPDLKKFEGNKINENVLNIISKHNELKTIKNKFFNRIKSNFQGKININTKIQNFEKISFDEFVEEIKIKQNIKFSLKEQDEWEEYYNTNAKICRSLIIDINQLDEDINQLIYDLYDFTSEEIAIIENSFKK